MKLFIISIFLWVGLFGLLMILDILMGLTGNGLFWKTINPFRVMEPAEYFIFFLFVLFFIFDIIGAFIKRQKQRKPSSN